MDNSLEYKKPLNQTAIKYIAIIVMTLDHIAHYLGEASPLYLPFRFISRLTGPIMAYGIAEGYSHTRNVKKYVLRLFICALISVIPYSLDEGNDAILFKIVDGYATSQIFLYMASIDKTLIVYGTNVIFSLLLGLLMIILWDKAKLPKWIKVLITLVACWLALFTDWKYINVLYCLVFYFFRNNKTAKWLSYTAVSMLYIFNVYFTTNPFNPQPNIKFNLYRMGTLLVIPFIEFLYNGEPGKKSTINKWLFYIYYPLHFLILYFIFG